MRDPNTTITELVEHIGQSHANIHSEQTATNYLAKLATVHIASRAQMPTYNTMVQHFLGTLKLPMTIYMLDYYLVMSSFWEFYLRPTSVVALSVAQVGPPTCDIGNSNLEVWVLHYVYPGRIPYT